MASTGHSSAAPGSWTWPEDIPEARNRFENTSGHPSNSNSNPESTPDNHDDAHPEQPQPRQQHWRPRTCRICLETVLPTFHPPSENLPGIFQSGPRVAYESEEGGRLLRPCKCKGTSKYVHEECLQLWRHADPGYAKRNYYQCPTCNYKYQLGRLGWAKVISSVGAQIGLTLAILLTVVFILGFVADPIINFALDPYSSLMPFSFSSWGSSSRSYYDEFIPAASSRGRRHRSGWIEHFTKGFASLGLASFLKFMFTSPIQFLFRSSGMGGRRTGQDRLNTITWIMVAVGVATFLWAVWKAVRAWSRRTLLKSGERVMNVQGDNDNDKED